MSQPPGDPAGPRHPRRHHDRWSRPGLRAGWERGAVGRPLKNGASIARTAVGGKPDEADDGLIGLIASGRVFASASRKTRGGPC